ncbi:MAG TPA: A24 family peptidase [Clostridia bacterium]|nr:A24 family peptidase [Clostridia bacterium]
MEYLTDNIRLISHLLVVIILIAAAASDIREHRIPDKLVLAGTAAGLVLATFNPQIGLLDSFIGGVTAGLVLLLTYYVTKGGLGLGDVKLFGCTGIYLGLEGTVSALVAASVLGGLYSLLLICMDRDNKKREIPFAPFILAGALAAIFL